MNPIDDQLNRLFRAARQTEAGPAATPPYGLETRVLAAWHGAAEPFPLWDIGVLVRGLVLATVIMGVSLWSALSSSSTATTTSTSDYLQLADTTVDLDNSP
jgi:hypothetical protein